MAYRFEHDLGQHDLHGRGGPCPPHDPADGKVVSFKPKSLFVTFSPPIIAHALKHYTMHGTGNYFYPDETYTKLGYIIDGDHAYRPKPKFPDFFR